MTLGGVEVVVEVEVEAAVEVEVEVGLGLRQGLDLRSGLWSPAQGSPPGVGVRGWGIRVGVGLEIVVSGRIGTDLLLLLFGRLALALTPQPSVVTGVGVGHRRWHWRRENSRRGLLDVIVVLFQGRHLGDSLELGMWNGNED